MQRPSRERHHPAQGEWAAEYATFRMRPITHRYAYIWADGIYLGAGLKKEHSCLLVVIGAREDGRKEFVAMELGYRESTECWAGVLRGLRERGLEAPCSRWATAPSASGPGCARCSPRPVTSLLEPQQAWPDRARVGPLGRSPSGPARLVLAPAQRDAQEHGDYSLDLDDPLRCREAGRKARLPSAP